MMRHWLASRAPNFVMRRHGFALRLAGCALSVIAGTVFVGLAPEADFIWVPNAVLLAYLLLAPRRRWPAYLCTGFLAQFSAGLLAGHHGIASGLILTLLNVGESLVSALLLRRRNSDLPDFTNPAYITRFLAFGVITGPTSMGAIQVLLTPLLHATSPLWQFSSSGSEFLQWIASDSLGACVATPACVAIFRARFRHSLFSLKHWAHLLPVVACSVAAFCQSRFPVAFLLYPLLVLVLLRLDLGWASLGALMVAGVATSFTVRGLGPFAASATISLLASAMVAQLYIAAAMVVLYSVSVVLETLRATQRRLTNVAALHKLVTDNSRDVMIIADFEGHRSFVSAAAADWGNWTQEEMLALNSLDLVHPDDEARMSAAVRILRAGADGRVEECRVRKRDGSYAWVEASLRTIRDPVTGCPTGILSCARDITERKRAEQQLADAYHALEELAITDPLTGLANRRRFDQCLLDEWHRSMRDHKPLSLLLVDVDLFKSYNDTYGHLRGDNCLKQIAESLQNVVSRSGDLVARFGGEEFAIILPNTPADGALQIGRDVCAFLRERQLPHTSNPTGVVTVSVGCATFVPQIGQHADSLVDCADRALYQAKHDGRNCVCAFQQKAALNIAGAEIATR